MKHSKCAFGQDSIDYLGHIVSREGVKPDPIKFSAITSWPVPLTLKTLRGFLGIFGFYRKFVRGYATIAWPLTELLKKDKFSWSEAAQEAFECLKQALVRALVLALPNFSQPFQVQTDGSGVGIGAVLMQQGHHVAYFSKKHHFHLFKASTYVESFLPSPKQCLNGANIFWVIIFL